MKKLELSMVKVLYRVSRGFAFVTFEFACLLSFKGLN